MTIKRQTWDNYIAVLRKVSDRAAKEMLAYIVYLHNQGIDNDEQIVLMIDYAFALATK